MKVRRLIKLLGINNDLYDIVIKAEENLSLNIKQPSNKSLLKTDDEVKILQMILDSQLEFSCCTGVEIPFICIVNL